RKWYRSFFPFRGVFLISNEGDPFVLLFHLVQGLFDLAMICFFLLDLLAFSGFGFLSGAALGGFVVLEDLSPDFGVESILGHISLVGPDPTLETPGFLLSGEV